MLIEITGLSGRQEMPLATISTTKADNFSAALRGILSDPEAPLTRRHLRAVVGRATVKGKEIAVERPKAAWAQMLDGEAG